MHLLAPLALAALGATPLAGGSAQVPTPSPLESFPSPAPEARRAAAQAPSQASSPKSLRIPLQVPKDQLRRLLEKELRKKKLLKNFQVVTSKFSNGRAVLTDFTVAEGDEPGTVRLEAHGVLRFDRRQLGVKWRGLKSHKKWYAKGAKDAARVRVSTVARLGGVGEKDGGVRVDLTKIRVKLVSRLSPARGLTARFGLDDRSVDWTPKSFAGFTVTGARIASVTRDAIRLELALRKP